MVLPDDRLIGVVVFYRRVRGRAAVDGLADRGIQAPGVGTRSPHHRGTIRVAAVTSASAGRLLTWTSTLALVPIRRPGGCRLPAVSLDSRGGNSVEIGSSEAVRCP